MSHSRAPVRVETRPIGWWISTEDEAADLLPARPSPPQVELGHDPAVAADHRLVVEDRDVSDVWFGLGEEALQSGRHDLDIVHGSPLAQANGAGYY